MRRRTIQPNFAIFILYVRHMEKIEIRYAKGKLILITLFCFFWVIITTYILLYTEPYSEYIAVKIITISVNGFVLYIGLLQIKLLIQDASVLTLSADGIEFNNNGKHTFFSWREIKSLTIEKVRAGRGSVDVLLIKCDLTEQKVPLGSLEKSTPEIKTLIGAYWHQPL